MTRKILAVVFPPFAVVDKGCGTYLVAFVLTCLGWIPGVIYAFVILKREQHKQGDKSSRVSKLQNNTSKSKSGDYSAQPSPFDRPRRMPNNNQTGGWQGQ